MSGFENSNTRIAREIGNRHSEQALKLLQETYDRKGVGAVFDTELQVRSTLDAARGQENFSDRTKAFFGADPIPEFKVNHDKSGRPTSIDFSSPNSVGGMLGKIGSGVASWAKDQLVGESKPRYEMEVGSILPPRG